MKTTMPVKNRSGLSKKRRIQQTKTAAKCDLKNKVDKWVDELVEDIINAAEMTSEEALAADLVDEENKDPNKVEWARRHGFLSQG